MQAIHPMQLLKDILQDYQTKEDHMAKGIPFNRGESEKEGKAWGHGQYANLPQEVYMQEAPKEPPHGTNKAPLNDTMSRLDGDTVASGRAKRKSYDRGMY
jgi:hypothetical protein